MFFVMIFFKLEKELFVVSMYESIKVFFIIVFFIVVDDKVSSIGVLDESVEDEDWDVFEDGFFIDEEYDIFDVFDEEFLEE